MVAAWPWAVAGKHVHFVAQGSEGEARLVCARARDAPRSLGDLARGQDIIAAMSVGLPVCKLSSVVSQRSHALRYSAWR